MLSQYAGISFWNLSLRVGVSPPFSGLEIEDVEQRRQQCDKDEGRYQNLLAAFGAQLVVCQIKEGAIRNSPMYISMYQE